MATVATPFEQEALRTAGDGRVLVPVGHVELLEGPLHPQLVLRHNPLTCTTFLQLILWGLQQYVWQSDRNLAEADSSTHIHPLRDNE
jgi:hypothetical protein